MSSALPLPSPTTRFAVHTGDGEVFSVDAKHTVHALRLALDLLECDGDLSLWTLCTAADGSLLAWSNTDDQNLRIRERRKANRAAA